MCCKTRILGIGSTIARVEAEFLFLRLRNASGERIVTGFSYALYLFGRGRLTVFLYGIFTACSMS
jgi:hypothetical protein